MRGCSRVKLKADRDAGASVVRALMRAGASLVPDGASPFREASNDGKCGRDADVRA